jgi:DNA-binding CsgD family transcriptional regulator
MAQRLPHIMRVKEGPRSLDTSVQDFVERLHKAETADKIWQEVCSEFSARGIDFIIYMFMRPSAPHDNPVAKSNLPNWWTDHYRAEEYARHDPFFITCHTFAPIRTGREYLDDHKDVLMPTQQDFIRAAGETGAISGISSPVRLANPGHFGGWNFLTRSKRAQFEALISTCCDRLQLMGFMAHEALQDASATPPVTRSEGRLSRRERECLRWLALGLRSAEIADRLGIALVTVDLHFRRVRAKLNAATREEALAKAIISGEVVL